MGILQQSIKNTTRIKEKYSISRLRSSQKNAPSQKYNTHNQRDGSLWEPVMKINKSTLQMGLIRQIFKASVLWGISNDILYYY